MSSCLGNMVDLIGFDPNLYKCSDKKKCTYISIMHMSINNNFFRSIHIYINNIVTDFLYHLTFYHIYYISHNKFISSQGYHVFKVALSNLTKLLEFLGLRKMKTFVVIVFNKIIQEY